MNKLTIILLISGVLLLSQNKIVSFAKENNEPNENAQVEIDSDQSNVFDFFSSGDSKNKLQIRIEGENGEDEDENRNFMIKGVIEAKSSNSITIGGYLIKIDPAVTEKVKIVGSIEVGMYAMAKGEIVNSIFYAEKIVVNNRNKKDFEDISVTPSVSPTITPTTTLSVTPTATPTPTVEPEDEENSNESILKGLIKSLENLLDSLKKLAGI